MPLTWDSQLPRSTTRSTPLGSGPPSTPIARYSGLPHLTRPHHAYLTSAFGYFRRAASLGRSFRGGGGCGQLAAAVRRRRPSRTVLAHGWLGAHLAHRMSLCSFLDRETTGTRKRDWPIRINSNEMPQDFSAHIDGFRTTWKFNYKFKQKLLK